MFKFFSKLFFGIGLWAYLKGRIGQYAFLVLGIFLVWYSAGEVEQFLILTDNKSYLASLLVVKNTFYFLVVIGFIIWPFLFSKPQQQLSGKTEKSPPIKEQRDIRQIKDDGFDRIRNQGVARSAVEIELDELDK